jgi:hypothetical protein
MKTRAQELDKDRDKGFERLMESSFVAVRTFSGHEPTPTIEK